MTYSMSYSRIMQLLLVPMLLGRRHSRVEVDADSVAVHMGWGFSARIARASIATVAADHGIVYGWGVHGWRGQWLVNGSSKGLVRLDLDPVGRARVLGVPVRLRVLRVSLDDPDGFIAAVRPTA